MHNLVKILTDDDGLKVDKPTWHLVINVNDTQQALCTGEVFGEGESARVTFKEKTTHKGVPCEKCHAIIKWFKSIKL